MLCKQLLSVAAAAFFGLTQAKGLTHGDVEDYDGGKIRWQQLGKGVFTGVPADQWDDAVHKRSDVDWDLEKYSAPQPSALGDVKRSLELESRNLQSFCQATTDCVKEDGLVQLVACMGAFVEAASLAKDSAESIWAFLNQPFVATVTGATIAGIAVNKATAGAPAPQPAECSTSNDDKDALLSALSAAVARSPTAYSVATDVVGPTTFYTVTVTAVPEDQTPATPVAGQCFTARSLGGPLQELKWTA